MLAKKASRSCVRLCAELPVLFGKVARQNATLLAEKTLNFIAQDNAIAGVEVIVLVFFSFMANISETIIMYLFCLEKGFSFGCWKSTNNCCASKVKS